MHFPIMCPKTEIILSITIANHASPLVFAIEGSIENLQNYIGSTFVIALAASEKDAPK